MLQSSMWIGSYCRMGVQILPIVRLKLDKTHKFSAFHWECWIYLQRHRWNNNWFHFPKYEKWSTWNSYAVDKSFDTFKEPNLLFQSTSVLHTLSDLWIVYNLPLGVDLIQYWLVCTVILLNTKIQMGYLH